MSYKRMINGKVVDIASNGDAVEGAVSSDTLVHGKIWTGTMNAYYAIDEKDDNTLYHITDDDGVNVDPIPVSGSSNLVESGGVYSMINRVIQPIVYPTQLAGKVLTVTKNGASVFATTLDTSGEITVYLNTIGTFKFTIPTAANEITKRYRYFRQYEEIEFTL